MLEFVRHMCVCGPINSTKYLLLLLTSTEYCTITRLFKTVD